MSSSDVRRTHAEPGAQRRGWLAPGSSSRSRGVPGVRGMPRERQRSDSPGACSLSRRGLPPGADSPGGAQTGPWGPGQTLPSAVRRPLPSLGPFHLASLPCRQVPGLTSAHPGPRRPGASVQPRECVHPSPEGCGPPPRRHQREAGSRRPADPRQAGARPVPAWPGARLPGIFRPAGLLHGTLTPASEAPWELVSGLEPSGGSGMWPGCPEALVLRLPMAGRLPAHARHNTVPWALGPAGAGRLQAEQESGDGNLPLLCQPHFPDRGQGSRPLRWLLQGPDLTNSPRFRVPRPPSGALCSSASAPRGQLSPRAPVHLPEPCAECSPAQHSRQPRPWWTSPDSDVSAAFCGLKPTRCAPSGHLCHPRCPDP